jgi:ATP-dependent protease ClpP protease subunit
MKNTQSSIKEEDYINPILLEIHSNGGFIHDAFSVVDTICRKKTIHNKEYFFSNSRNKG